MAPPVKIASSMTPDELFAVPGRDPGIAWIVDPGPLWRRVEGGRIAGFAHSSRPGVQGRIEAGLRGIARANRLTSPVEIASGPVILDAPRLDKPAISNRGRLLLSGAAGTRSLNGYVNSTTALDLSAQDALVDWSARLRALPAAPIPVAGPPRRGTPVLIEARNFFNYYHFLTETLARLTVLDVHDPGGKIHIHAPGKKVAGFTRAFVDALFPEYAQRVRFRHKAWSNGPAVAVLDAGHYYFQSTDEDMAPLDDLIPEGCALEGRTPTRHAAATLRMNGYDACLRRLRERALRMIEGRDTGHLPRRIWIARREGVARDRAMPGEGALREDLARLGFAPLEFETLEPLDQVAAMARAEAVVGIHGAGFANMLFAAPQARVFEIGTVQTLLRRWRDFWPLAHVSGATYATYFTDHHTDTPDDDPVFAVHSIAPPALGDAARTALVDHVSAILTDAPLPPGRARAAALIDRLAEAGEAAAARRLLEGLDRTAADPDLAVALADLRQAAGELEGVYAALELARAADPGRPALLRRMIWLTHRLGRDDRLPALVADMKRATPDAERILARLRWLPEALGRVA